MLTVEFPQIIERGCGLDVHQKNVVATIQGTDIQTETRTFLTFTEDLEKLISWLNSHNVTHIAMESTGVYWKPVYYVLEPHFKILLVNARHIKNVPGHKTDKKDSEWIAKLLLSGLLKGSFVPPQHIRELRTLNRYKKKLINQRSREKNRLQNVLEDANIKLGSVISDVFGKTGLAIIECLSRGITHPETLAEQARGSLVRKKNILIQALNGRLTLHHQFMLRLILDRIYQINTDIGKIENQIISYAAPLSEQVELLRTIPGVSYQTALAILSETGTDMEVFHSEKHLASWTGVCPGSNESAGKKKSSRTTQGNKYLKTALMEASWAASHTKNTRLCYQYHTLAVRRGKKKAAMAIGHKILTAAYFILRDKTPYREPVIKQEIVDKQRQAQIERLQNRLDKIKTLASNN